jgi:hypothetical protein
MFKLCLVFVELSAEASVMHMNSDRFRINSLLDEQIT